MERGPQSEAREQRRGPVIMGRPAVSWGPRKSGQPNGTHSLLHSAGSAMASSRVSGLSSRHTMSPPGRRW